MSKPRIPNPAQALVSVLSSSWDGFAPGLTDELEAILGPIIAVSDPMPFSHTSYYDRELGTPITRRMVSFERFLPLDALVETKLATDALETAYARPDGRRVFNIDPGYLTLERLVLASGKNFPHRVYLGNCVWADLNLTWNAGDWQALPWTFSDYNGKILRKYLTDLRMEYKTRLFAALES